MTLVEEEGSNKPHGCRAKAKKASEVIVVGQYTNDPPPVVNLANDGVEDNTQDCYVPTVEWCPNTGYAGNDNGTVGETQGNVEVNVTSTASQKKLGILERKERQRWSSKTMA
ncbi:hypothetical protein Salat_0632800 [Sesamum alatum]|uniref:Uncharacterized protein n=1 Tax=Sesamum alatum TaxID=300844 RepID=A0AAE1YQD7_9LAMI|nr:hypothetical protein Salat_0632800 [Sesamum alatum]